MVLSLRSEKDDRAQLQNLAYVNFGGISKQQSVIRSRSDLYISDVFRRHNFFPSPTVQPDKRKKATNPVELLPNAITSKEWKAYALSKREDQKGAKKGGKKRKQDRIGDDVGCPPKSQSTKKPIVEDDELAASPAPSTPVDVRRRSNVFSSAVKINTISKPKRLRSGKAPAIKNINRKLQLEDQEADDVSNMAKSSEDNSMTDEIQVGEYVLIPLNDSELPGRVTKILRNGKLMISLMERSAVHTGWKWPEKPKISSFYDKDVSKHLDDPELIEGEGLVFKFEEV